MSEDKPKTRAEAKMEASVKYGRVIDVNTLYPYEVTDSVSVKLPWWKRVLNPIFRRWAYGVTVAAVGVYAVATEQPQIAVVAAPLILALFYVDSNGEPR